MWAAAAGLDWGTSRATIVGLCLAAFCSLAAVPGAAAHPGAAWWTQAQARSLLLARTFTATDTAQPDRPEFRFKFERLGARQLRPLGRSRRVRGVRAWREFALAGTARDLSTDSEIAVQLTLHAVGRRGYVLTGFRGPPADTSQPALPLRATFYYGWYPQNWNQLGINPYTYYRPSAGFYASGDAGILRRHVEAMHYGNIEAGIWSWWGKGHHTDARLAKALAVARPTPFRWAVYHEAEGYGDPSIEELRGDLEYIRDRYARSPAFLRIDGRFVVFVYSADDGDCEVAERWRQANTVGAYVVLKVFPGFRSCSSQPDGWHQYAPAQAVEEHLPDSIGISPGFWLRSETALRLPRDLAGWRQSVARMVASGATFQLVITFNEWGEGTSVESADEWASASGYGSYLDVLHEAG